MSSRKQPVKGRSSHFPVGIGYIAAYLEENNFKVDILDNEVECLNKYEISEVIENKSYDFIGLTGMSSNYNYIKRLSRLIKEKTGKPIILGGPLATYSSDVVLRTTMVDTCIIGEGEETILDLLLNYEKRDDVDGIVYKDSGKVFKNSTRKFKKSRSEYPFPAYHLFNMEPYLNKMQVQYEGAGSEFLNRETSYSKNIGILTGIGCPYKCRFCSRSVVQPRLRSIESIIEEIKYCIEHFHIDGVRFLDDLLLVNEKRTKELCQRIAPLNITWSGQARTNAFTDEMASTIKEAGCIGVGFGYETGSDRMLDAMRKQTSVKKHKTATAAALKHGLAIRVQIMFGFPGENLQSIEETVQFFKDIEIPPRRFNILTPLPGSDVYRQCIEKKIIVDEAGYLEEISNMEAGFNAKKVLINLTEMDDTEFESLLSYAETKMEANYLKILDKRIPAWKRKITHFLKKAIYRIENPHRLKLFIKNHFRKVPIKNVLSKQEIEDQYFRI